MPLGSGRAKVTVAGWLLSPVALVTIMGKLRAISLSLTLQACAKSIPWTGLWTKLLSPRMYLEGPRKSTLFPQLQAKQVLVSVLLPPRIRGPRNGPTPVSLGQQSCWGEGGFSDVIQGPAGHSCVLRTLLQPRLEHRVRRHSQHGPWSRRPGQETACPGAWLAPVPA